MISTIVITHNRAESLEHCIKSLINQTHKHYEIIVIDDGSTDNTKQTIRLMQKKYKIIKYFRQENKGRGAARNLGLRKARGDIIAFTDDDCIVPGDWLENIKKTFEDNPEVSAVGGAIINNDKNLFGEAAYLLNFSSWLPTGKKRCLKDIPTANIAYKKKDIKKIEFPVEYSTLDYEDTIFNSKLIKLDKKVLFDPSIRVHHKPMINTYNCFLENQQRKALSFLLRGYKLHGLAGGLLIKFKFLNLFCPRLLLVFFRCCKFPKYLPRFVVYSPFIFKGELERGLTIILNRK